jgi:hypothetical protein
MTNFNNIKAEATRLLSEFKKADVQSSDLESFFDDAARVERTAMLAFFRSFDSVKAHADISPIEFNEKAGFTSEYKDMMTGRV